MGADEANKAMEQTYKISDLKICDAFWKARAIRITILLGHVGRVGHYCKGELTLLHVPASRLIIRICFVAPVDVHEQVDNILMLTYFAYFSLRFKWHPIHKGLVEVRVCR